ncbi:MAG TPA: VOC family protein [Paucimonas sp.]|nr:VOC family protein [Paucimonas sp.]
MSQANSLHNRAVWMDIPVADLDRAAAFYRGVLAIQVEISDYEGFKFGILEHEHGNGGCLVPNAEEIVSNGGLLVYMNVDGRIRDAESKVTALGGKVLQGTHAIGPHGFRAIVLDSEGNRIALHSETDA